MPILLTTAWNPGSKDPGTTYSEVKVVEYKNLVESKEIILTCKYGNTVFGVFEQGLEGPEYYNIRNVGNDAYVDAYYDMMIATLPQAGETIYEAAGREIYQWLIDQYIYDGTII